MRNKLKANTLIWFDPGENGTFNHCLKITDCIGEGGSGIIYTGMDDNGVVWTVKESFPNNGNSVYSSKLIYRREDGTVGADFCDRDYDLNADINRIPENENKVASALQNDLTNKVMAMPFYNGVLKGAAVQLPGESKITVCNQLFTRMQYIKGVTADKAVFTDSLDKLKTVENILKAIEAIHRAGFILGDIKPANIMIADDGRCFVLDYGSAVKTDDKGVAEIDPLNYPHSSGYIAPELFDPNNTCLTGAYDVYSLGALLMDLLMPERTGMIREIQYRKRMEYPYSFLFEDLNNYGAFSRLSIQQELPVSPVLADQLSRILQKSLADEREKRYQSAGELLLDYRVFLNNYQYKTVKPQKYDYHLLWQSSYEYLAERLNNTLTHKISSINSLRTPAKSKPQWWKLETVNGCDQDGNCYQDATDISDVMKKEDVYLYGYGGAGKTIKACQIMQRCLRQLPVLYVDSGLLNCDEDYDCDISGERIIEEALLKQLDYLKEPAQFIDTLAVSRDQFLLVLDNINNISSSLKSDFLQAIVSLKNEFNGLRLLLIGRNGNIGNDMLDKGVRKIRLQPLEQQDNELLKIPFFYMRYQEMKYRDPQFKLDTDDEVRFLDKYMDHLGKDYYRYEKLIYDITKEMVNGLFSSRYIEKAELEALMGEDCSAQQQAEVIDILTDKLGLLVPDRIGPSQYALFDKEKDVYEFAHDIYLDYFTARWISSVIDRSVADNSPMPLSAVRINICAPDALKILMKMVSEQKQDKVYEIVKSSYSHEAEYYEFINLFTDYYWYWENHTANRWAQLGADRDNAFSLSVAVTSLMMSITADDHSAVEKVVDLCRREIAGGNSEKWATDYLGMLIMHDALETAGYSCYVDTEYFNGCILADDSETAESYYCIEGQFGKIRDFSLSDGVRLYYGDDPPKEIKAIFVDEAEDTDTVEDSDAILVRRKFWKIIRGLESDEDILEFQSENGTEYLRYLATVLYQWDSYEVYVTVSNPYGNGIEEIVILNRAGIETGENNVRRFRLETVDNREIRDAVFRIFMNRDGGKKKYDIISK